MTPFSRRVVQEQLGGDTPTERQVDHVIRLIHQVYGYETEPARIYVGAVRQGVADGSITKRRASQMIENLTAQRTAAKADTVPLPPERRALTVDYAKLLTGGRYAVRDDEEDRIRFLRVNVVRDDTSKWNGWVFVDEQAGEEFYRVGSQRSGFAYRGRYANLLDNIAVDEPAAFALYGQELGKCGVCGRTLTDEVSRERGIGPVCWEKVVGG